MGTHSRYGPLHKSTLNSHPFRESSTSFLAESRLPQLDLSPGIVGDIFHNLPLLIYLGHFESYLQICFYYINVLNCT